MLFVILVITSFIDFIYDWDVNFYDNPYLCQNSAGILEYPLYLISFSFSILFNNYCFSNSAIVDTFATFLIDYIKFCSFCFYFYFFN